MTTPIPPHINAAISHLPHSQDTFNFSTICTQLFKTLLLQENDYKHRLWSKSDADFSNTFMGKTNEREFNQLHQSMKTIYEKMLKQECPYQRMKELQKREEVTGLDLFEEIYKNPEKLNVSHPDRD